MTITEKVAYLKGLAEGLGLDPEQSKESKLISVMIDVLENIALDVADLEQNAEALGEEIDVLSDDLADVEEILYGEDDDIYYDDDEDGGDEDDDDDEDDDFFQVECPNCKETLVIDDSVIQAGGMVCPSCEEKIEVHFGDACGCGCGCGEEE